MRRWVLILATAGVLGTANTLRAAQVGLIKIDGVIGPATATYIARAIDHAAAGHAECLVIQLDTPGGLFNSTEDIVRKFLHSPVPTVVYVAPETAHATSAGCFITIAADIAAMAPNTSIGAAHIVTMGGSGGESQVDDVMKQKMENFGMKYIETIAAQRKRNVEWAKSSVKDSATITASEALELRVIDLIAKDLPDLLKQLDGREVNGRKLQTANAQVIAIPMALREKVFQMLRPEVMFILMLVAIYGIIGELSNPGAILPGVVGAVALILMLYMSAVLPINLAGLALIALAIVLFIADVYATTHGVLTVGGIVAFLLGALMLFNKAEPGFRLSLAYILPGVAVTALFFAFIVTAGLRAQLLPVRAGRETMVGRAVRVILRTDERGGKVFVEGEYWNAVSEAPIEAGQPAEIVAVNGLTLKLKPKTT